MNSKKDITIQIIVGLFVAFLVLAFFMKVFDAQKHTVNHDLVLDKREWSCVESKTEKYNTTVMVGKVPITQWHNREVCITMKRN